jgi:hypothetical protein
MSDNEPVAVDLNVLEPDANQGYLPRAIPTSRDDEIARLLSQVLAEDRVAQFARQVGEGHSAVLRAFAERMATAAVRRQDPALLRLGMIALLLPWPGPDSRETLLIFPLFYDAIQRIGFDGESFIAAIRQLVGDQPIAPFVQFLQRSEPSKSLEAMGYAVGSDQDGFRYVRNW